MRFGIIAAAAMLAATVAAGGCANGTVTDKSDDDDTTSTTTTNAGSGGSTGVGGQGMGGSGGDPHPCGLDCSAIDTPACTMAECNLTTLLCEVVPVPNDTSCEDGLFCTVNDVCVAGVCMGGQQNDCGDAPDACEEITCNEMSKTCGTMMLPNGDACVDNTNLCLTNTTCTNGQCTGTPTDCFFAPVPDDCHVAVCNPANGMCEPIIGNENASCTDLNDLCTDNKTCVAGVCQGGAPKDCSALTIGCNNGVCNTMSGACELQPVPAGGACIEGDTDCTLGICNMNGMCIPTPANENGMCDDLSACTSGEICTAGVCGPGTAVTQCINADGCCPATCTEINDDDCGCSLNLATSATGTSSGGGSGNLGPAAWNNGSVQGPLCQSNFGWISNNTTPNSKFMQYTWPAPVQIGSIFLDANLCSECNGRTLDSAEVQWWDGNQWQNATTVTGNNGDLALTFTPKLNTTQLRLFNVTAGSGCGQASNTLVYEWFVWTGSNCMPPP